MFDQSNLIKFPSLSSFDSPLLCARAVGLNRLAKVLDSVLDVLVGPSLKREQFDTPYEVCIFVFLKYPLTQCCKFCFNQNEYERVLRFLVISYL